uniref:SH2 domain-containing protein n=1 Tax=Strongyloides papillosus TaxID=174720 RepID=A0A0N5BC28_STREA
MNLSIDHNENIRSLQSKANYLGRKILNHPQIGGKKYETCYIHRHLPPHRLHNVLCSYRHMPPEENNYRPSNINKQRKVPKIPHIILSTSKVPSYPVRNTLTKNYVIKNGELQKKYSEEKIFNYTVNCMCNNKNKLKEENVNIKDLLKVKDEVEDDFSKFLNHYYKSLQLIGELEKTNTNQILREKKQENLCRNCFNKTCVNSPSVSKSIQYVVSHKKSEDYNSKKNINENHAKRKNARFEDVYKPKLEIEVPKLIDIGMDENVDEDVEDDEEEAEDYIWEDESISEMYRNSQKPIMPINQKIDTPINEANHYMDMAKHVSNEENNIYSKRTSAGISTIREIEEYVTNGKVGNNDDRLLNQYQTADRSFTEFVETPKQYLSTIDRNSNNSTSSNDTLVPSVHSASSLKVNSSNLKKWDNIKLVTESAVINNSSSSSSKKSSKTSNKSIKSFISPDNNNHKNIYEKTKEDVINYNKELHISKYQLTETTKNRMSLSYSNEIISQNSSSSKSIKKQEIILVGKSQRQDSILSSLSNNLNDNVSSKNDKFQRSPPSLSIISSQQLQQTNRNIQLVSSKNDISELDSLRSSSVNTFNGDELIDDNHIITSDNKSSLKSGNNSYEVKKITNEVSLSSLSSLTNQNNTPSSLDKIDTSSSNDKKKDIRKNNFSPSKNHQQSPHFSNMINEEPKTVNSTSSSTNLSSLEREEERTIKYDGKIEDKMPIYQNLKNSGKSKLISNLYGIEVSNNKEVNSTDVIATLDDISKSISTSDNNNLSNTQSLINAGNNIYLKEFDTKENRELKENANTSLNYKFNLIFNDKKMNENSSLKDESLLSDIPSISELENSIKNMRTDKNIKYENVIEKDDINEENGNLLSQNNMNNELNFQKSSLLNDIDNILNGDIDENNLSPLSTIESSNSSTAVKKLSNKSSSQLSNKSLSQLSSKSSLKSSKTSSSISTLLSKNLSNVSSSLSSLPSSATSLNEIK